MNKPIHDPKPGEEIGGQNSKPLSTDSETEPANKTALRYFPVRKWILACILVILVVAAGAYFYRTKTVRPDSIVLQPSDGHFRTIIMTGAAQEVKDAISAGANVNEMTR